MSISHYTENLGDYYYTLGSGFSDANVAAYTTRAMAVASFGDEFSQTRQTIDQDDTVILNDEQKEKAFKVSVVDEDGKTTATSEKENKEEKEKEEKEKEEKEKEKKDKEKEKEMEEKEKQQLEKERERKKRLASQIKEQELQKARAEMEFFFLTCMAVKMNLKEAYPDSTQIRRKKNINDGNDNDNENGGLLEEVEEFDLVAENPWDLFKIAQEQKVPMNKFALWTETYLREKYGLGKFRFGKTNIKLPNIGLEEKFKAAKVVASVQGRKGKEKAQQFGTTVGEKTSQAAQKVGERVRRMTVEAGDMYQKFRASRGASTVTNPPSAEVDVNGNQVPHTQSLPATPKKNRNLKPGKHGLKVNTMSDAETSVDDEDGTASPPVVAVPQSDPILEETTAGGNDTENNNNSNEKKKQSELEKQTGNSINNSTINNGNNSDKDKDNKGSTETTSDNNLNSKKNENENKNKNNRSGQTAIPNWYVNMLCSILYTGGIKIKSI